MEQQLWCPSYPAAAANSSSSSGGASSGWAVAPGAGARATAEQLQAALTSSLVLMLWTCATTGSSGGSGGGSGASSGASSKRSGPAAHVVVLQQSAAGSAGLRGLCDVGQVLRMVQVATAHSREELEVSGGVDWNARLAWTVLLLALWRCLPSPGKHVTHWL
jgi:hypothetical protein